jgi:hypothetical protein
MLNLSLGADISIVAACSDLRISAVGKPNFRGTWLPADAKEHS